MHIQNKDITPVTSPNYKWHRVTNKLYSLYWFTKKFCSQFMILISFFKEKNKNPCSYSASVVAQRVGKGIALLFHDRGTRRGWVVSSTPRPHFTPGNTQYPFYRRLGGPQGQSGWAENLVPTGIQSQTIQPLAQSLYRLSYPGHT